MIKAVLFDYDGVLVDSMDFHVYAWQIVFKDFNIDIHPEEVLLTEGARSIELARKVLSEHNISITEDKLADFVNKKQNTYRQITRAQFSEEAGRLISKIKQSGMRVGVVSGGARFDIESLLPPEVRRQIDVIVSGEDVRNGKPDPEGYLKAAQELGASPPECLVIENAPFGIQAAQRAGMKVAAVATTLPRHRLNGADFHADDLSDLNKQWPSIFKSQAQTQKVH